MTLLAILTLHQGLALGAAGLFVCALSEARPAIQAVRSRFEKLQGENGKSMGSVSKTLIETAPSSDTESHTTDSSSSRGSQTPIPVLAGSVAFGNPANELCKASGSAQADRLGYVGALLASERGRELIIGGVDEKEECQATVSGSESMRSVVDDDDCMSDMERGSRVEQRPQTSGDEVQSGTANTGVVVRQSKITEAWTSAEASILALLGVLAGLFNLILVSITSVPGRQRRKTYATST